MCQILWCPSVQVCSNSLLLVPFFASHTTEHFLHHIKTSPCLSILLTRSLPSQMTPSPFFHSCRQEFWSITSAWHFHAFASFFRISYNGTCLLPRTHTVRCFILSLLLSTKIHFSFGLDLNSSQSFHSSTKTMEAGCILQGHAHFLSLSCFIVTALTSAKRPSSLLLLLQTHQFLSYFLSLSSYGVPLHVPLPLRYLF